MAPSPAVEIRTPQLKPLPNLSQGVCDAGCNTALSSYRVAGERQLPSQQKRSGLKAEHQTSGKAQGIWSDVTSGTGPLNETAG
jgi:hypothetical protein